MREPLKQLRDRIAVGRGAEPADLVFKNGRVVNVFSGEIVPADVAVFDGRVVGIGHYRAREAIDIEGRYLAPGLIDSHVHLESSKLMPHEYTRAVVPRGTVAIVADPHEIANVLGVAGIRLLLSWSAAGPLSVYVMLPSCVPATDLETSGAVLGASDLAPLLQDRRVLGLAELMNYPGLLRGNEEILEKILLATGKRADGHAPGLSGKDLCAYVAAGIRSDHECTTSEEALEKLRLGMFVMMREGSAAKNLADLAPVVRAENRFRFLLATDDRSPEDLMDEGHLDHILRKAVALGVDPVAAIQMATINPAVYFGLEDVGAIAPGYRADLIVLEDLERMRVSKVFKSGVCVAEEGRLIGELNQGPPVEAPFAMRIDWSCLAKLEVKARSDRIKVIDLVPSQILNRAAVDSAKVRSDRVLADPERDILKLAVIERHHATGNLGVGFVRGFGLGHGALGSSVAHDSHNIIVLGATDEEIEHAARVVSRMGGGQAVVRNGRCLAALPLPVAGLMSDRPLAEVVARARSLRKAARDLGCALEDPFMALSFLALPVIPELRVTDRGLVDVKRAALVSLFADA